MPSQRSEPLDLAVTLRFLRALARSNDRVWFHEHRSLWDTHIRHGFEDLVTMLLLDAAQIDRRLAHVDPRACLFRLANDTRFHERTPYKTWLSAWLSPGGKNGAFAGYYIHIEPGASEFSAGIYVPEKPALHALRTALANDTRAAREFDRILGSRALARYLPLDTAARRVMPRGFAKDHPRSALLRARRFMIRRDVPDAELQRRGAFAAFRDAIRATAPLIGWLDAHAAHESGPTHAADDDAMSW